MGGLLKTDRNMLLLAIVEIAIMTLAVIFDLLLPSLILVFVGIAFCLIRKEKITWWSFENLKKPYLRLILIFFGLAILISLFDYGLIIPILNNITGSTQDMGIFEDLKGNIKLLILLLAYSWTLAAIVEEFAYRGFFQNRIISIFSDERSGIIIASISTSLLFGFMHMEQGPVGIITTAIDALLLSIVRYKFKSIWASVLVHGFSNTIGIVLFFFLGPLNGLW